MEWFTKSRICDILSRFDRVTLIGDSMLRQAAQALNVLLRNDLVDGGKATWSSSNALPECNCHQVFDNPRCASVAAVNTQEILQNAPSSISCAVRPALVSCESISILGSFI